MGYSVRADSENIFGVINLKRWADLNNKLQDSEIAARIEAGIAYAYERLNSRLRHGPYEIPFEEPVDPVIVDLSARIVGIWLYDSRGIVDSDPSEFDQLARHRKFVERTLSDIHGLRVVLSHEIVSTAYPQTVLDQ